MYKQNSPGRILGAILLIAGTTIGAAMLALPVATGQGGLIPSIIAMFVMWLYLLYAALCLIEVNFSVPEKEANLISMAGYTLGKPGKIICWGAYLFLLYALNTAYISVTTSLFQEIMSNVFGWKVPALLCQTPILIVFSVLLKTGVRVVDLINRLLMIGLLISFVLLVACSSSHIQLENFVTFNMGLVIPALSVVVTAFGYHIIIPSLVSYVKRDVGGLKKAVFIGSFIPLFAYIVWQCTTLGIVPAQGEISIETAYAEGKNGAQILALLLKDPMITKISECFIFFSVITSFLGVSLSLYDFLADGLKISKTAQGKWKLFFFTFVPPMYFALSDPHIFFTALEYAGAFGVVVLLALIPGLMVWRKRYVLHLESSYNAPGGQVALALFLLISLILIGIEVIAKTHLL